MSAFRVPVALQLYSVREPFERDPEAALARTAAAGYRFVEWFGGFRGRSASGWRSVLEQHGLRVLALHVDFEQLRRGAEGEDLSPLIADCRTLDCTTVVCPSIAPERRGDDEAWRATGAALDRAAYQFGGASMRVLYHNHDFDLGPPTLGLTPLEHLLGAASLGNVGAEVDVFWAAWAGWDPVVLLRRLRGVAAGAGLVHLKDGLLPAAAVRSATPYQRIPFRPLGQGNVDLRGVVREALAQGVSGLVVEQDFCDGDPFDAAAASLAYLGELPELRRA